MNPVVKSALITLRPDILFLAVRLTVHTTTGSVSRPRGSAGVLTETEMKYLGRGPRKSKTVPYLVSN